LMDDIGIYPLFKISGQTHIQLPWAIAGTYLSR
jgi:hypothetical protein